MGAFHRQVFGQSHFVDALHEFKPSNSAVDVKTIIHIIVKWSVPIYDITKIGSAFCSCTANRITTGDAASPSGLAWILGSASFSVIKDRESGAVWKGQTGSIPYFSDYFVK